MIPGFGKQSVTIGSAPNCDVVLAAPGVLPEHARIVHQGGGKLIFIPAGPNTAVQVHAPGGGPAQSRMLSPGEQVPFDFRTAFVVANVPVPLSHPAICMQVMAQGQQQAQRGHLIIGRDPARASLVIQHPSVSSQHATVMLDRMMVVDHGSTSGTFVGTNRAKLPPNQPSPLDPNGIIAFGPVPVPVSLLAQIAQGGVAQPGGYPSMGGQQQMQQHPHAQSMGGAVASPGTMIAPHGMSVAAAAASLETNAFMASQGAGARPAAPAPGPAPAGASPAKKNKTILGQLDFGAGNKPVRTIGRTPDNDIVIQHPQVSSRHALLHQVGGQLFIEDRGSANGSYVRGHRIAPGQKISVQSGEKIYIGPMPLQIEISATGAAEVVQEDYAADRWAGKPLYEIEAWSLQLQVPDRDNPGEMKTLLDNVSFKALPGDMIALMGPSGAGKTTLLLTLNGYLPPTSGVVRINGEDLYAIYDTLRGSIGYVPQDDLVHPELTVFEAVRYSAKFRLPPDYSNEEIDQRVEQTLKDLGLDGVKNLQIGRPEKKVLSGGQRKRVNIALELVTDPVILFLDEPTSGLAADDTTALIELLANLTKETGKTIIMTIHQPAKDEFEKFTHCLIMGYGGIPTFFGPTQPDAYRFFGSFKERQGKPNDVDNPRDMFEMLAARERPIYERLRQQNPNASRQQARSIAATEWRGEFFQDGNATYRRMYSGRREIGSGQSTHGLPPGRAQTRGQLGLLLSRYFKCKVRDVSGLIIMLSQAPIIGGLLTLVFGGQEDTIPQWCLAALQQLSKDGKGGMESATVLAGMESTRDDTPAIFFLVVAACWFGTSNAAREIVSERAIYLRERMVNLGLFNYVFSKYILLAFFCIVQCTILLGIVFFGLGLPGGGEGFGQMLGACVATALVSTALGLLLSTMVTSSEAAMALTPIALIPQIILGGLLVPITSVPHLKYLYYAIPSRWGFEAAIVPNRIALEEDKSWSIDLQMPEPISSSDDFIENGDFKCATAQVAAEKLKGSWGFFTYETQWVPYAVLIGFTLTLLVILCFILKRRDPV
ncbi:MAG: FHA domain-containing protein [Polyangiaceae bacterium]|jgi:ABC-type multidrug transport system ATPase subunit/pSer/pThr/pTyr-binding forkhead associated (FHA) protein|nr:FHA domain-containing protein [Polyangiaceae bacterium]